MHYFVQLIKKLKDIQCYKIKHDFMQDLFCRGKGHNYYVHNAHTDAPPPPPPQGKG